MTGRASSSRASSAARASCPCLPTSDVACMTENSPWVRRDSVRCCVTAAGASLSPRRAVVWRTGGDYLPPPPRGAPPPPTRGAPPNPGGADCVLLLCDLLAAVMFCPVMTTSPSCRSPSTTSVEAPSVKPILMRRACGLPSGPSTQTRLVWPGSTGQVDGANCTRAPCCAEPLLPAPFAPALFASAAPPSDCAPPPAFACWPAPRREPWPFLFPAPPCEVLPPRSDDCGVNLSAEFGTLSTSLRSSIVTVRLAVMPGFNFCSGLLTSMTTL